MTALDLFALLVLVVLVATAVGGALLLGAMPGRIARDRHHPQAEAVAVCGWIGLLTLGLLLPVAYVWAYWRFPATASPATGSSATGSSATGGNA